MVLHGACRDDQYSEQIAKIPLARNTWYSNLCGINSAKIRKTILSKIAALQADLAALDRLDAEYGGARADLDGRTQGRNLGAHSSGEDLAFDEDGGLSLAKIVREAIDGFESKSFTKGDVLAVLSTRYPNFSVNEASVASLLSRLGKSGALRIVQPGVGQMPSKYQNPNPPIS